MAIPLTPTRRTFLAGVASTLASCSAVPTAVSGVREGLLPAARRGARIVIVGAGVAGLTCAYRLQQAGFATRIFEANDRVGGRTWTLRDYFAQGQIAEHGGEFISLDQIPVQQLARELGLRLVNVNRHEKGRTIYFFDGARYSVDQARNEYFDGVRERVRKDVRAAGYPTTYTQSTPAGRTLDRTSVTEWIDENVPDGVKFAVRRAARELVRGRVRRRPGYAERTQSSLSHRPREAPPLQHRRHRRSAARGRRDGPNRLAHGRGATVGHDRDE